MRDRPSGAELLRLARRVLRDLADELPGDRRYTALMIGSAMAMAARELEAGEESEARTEALRSLLGATAGDEAPHRALAEALRGGCLDGDPAVHAWLCSEVEGRLKLSNPKRLKDNT